MKLRSFYLWIILITYFVSLLTILVVYPTDRLIPLSLCSIGFIIVLWLTEVVPIGVASLFPIVLFPVLDLLPIKSVASSYGHPIIFLFMGGFIMALAIEKHQLHKRIALVIINRIGASPVNILLGFLVSTFFLSMWISNTATAVIMLPIAISVFNVIPEMGKNFRVSLLLIIAYAANLGGMSTLIGTPPNVVFKGFIDDLLNVSFDFFDWFIIAFPSAVTLIGLAFILITKVIFPIHKNESHDVSSTLMKLKNDLGKPTIAEKKIIIVFSIVIFGWMFKDAFHWIIGKEVLDDTLISMAGGIMMFLIPNKNKALLDWSDISKLPWEIIFLFGGGLAIASLMKSSGIIASIAQFI